MPRGIITDANITGNVTANGGVFQTVAGQTTDLRQNKLNSGTIVGGTTSSGSIYVGASPTRFVNFALTAASASSTTIATYTTSSTATSNPVAIGQKVIISNVTPSYFNGSFVITAIGGSAGAWTFTVTAPSAPFTVGSATAFGTFALDAALYLKTPSVGASALILHATTNQNAYIFEYRDSLNTLKTYITTAGDFVAPAISAIWSITSSAQDVSVNAIRARHSVANYRANLQTWENTSTVLAGVNAQGQFFTGGTTPIRGSTTVAINTQTPTGTTDITITTAAAHGIAVGQTVFISGITPAGYNGTWVARGGTTGSTLVIGIGSNPGAITVAGVVRLNPQVSITPSSANTTPIVARGVVSQAANLQEWQDSNNAVRASVGPTGNITTISGLTLSGANSPINLNGSLGTSGQVLTSSGAGTTPTWTTVSGGTFTGGTLTSDLILAAGSTTVEPIRFQTNTSTPVATSGALDYDGDKFYAVTSGTATGRLMVPAIARVFSNANATAATTNSSQSIFQAGARALTLEAAKTYYFRLNLGVNFTFSAVPAAIQLVPTFTQTPVAINYSAVWASGTSGGVQSFRTTSTSAVSISPTLSASITGGTILIEGFFQSNATTGGTVEFKYQISTGGGSSATAQTGTLLEIQKIGTGAPGIISGAWA